MLDKLIRFLNRVYKNKKKKRKQRILKKEREDYINNDCIPWSKGYSTYKTEVITKNINDNKLIELINANKLPTGFGYRLDERVIEYPWIFAKLSTAKGKILDAGSTFNFDHIVNHPIMENKDLTIFTFAPESNNYCHKRISYVFDDLRNLPFKNELFEVIVSQSTIEHIDMDNSIYGYDINHNENEQTKSYEYLKVIKELIRVLKHKGKLLLTFPFGKFENHGFFQQFDDEMLDKILNLFQDKGGYEVIFFQYKNDGWNFAERDNVSDSESFNPHTGKGKKDDFAAHSRAIACIEFKKN